MTLKFEESENGVKRLWLSDEFTTMEISHYVSDFDFSTDGLETQAQITFPMVTAALDLRKTVAEVSKGTHEILIALGWKPPS